MSKTYMIKEGLEAVWKEKISPEKYERFTTEGFIIDDVVELSRDWDMALQLVLDQVRIIKDEA